MQLANIWWDAGRQPRIAVRNDNAWTLLPAQLDSIALGETDDVIRQGMTGNDLQPLLKHTESLDTDSIQWRPSVIHPQKILCIGLNYRRHAMESGLELPTSPVVFSKFSNALAAHREPVPIPRATSQGDYEAELALVIGKKAHNVARADALNYVWGYTIADDVSARDLQMKTSQWLLGKSLDKFLPLGPALVSADAIRDPDALDISLHLNGEERQHSNTRDMIFSCAEIIAYLSTVWTLEPGDVICTGTPEGVILGRPPAQRQWLKSGDEVTVRIEGLGEQQTLFVADGPADSL